MTTPTSDEPFPPQAPFIQDAPPPFEDQASFPLTKAVNLGQLGDEISAALHRQISFAQLGPEDPAAPISETNQATLAISPGSVDQAAVQEVIDAHIPEAGYGVPTYIKEFDDLLYQVSNNPDAALSADDVEIGVRGLLLRESGRRSTEQPTGPPVIGPV
jgi:hypothetical protein